MPKDTKISKLLPSAFELVGFIFVSILVIIIGNSHQLLNYYGLESSNQVVGHSTGAAVNQGLSHLDNFQVTDEIVTFLIWAMVGVFCFSVVGGLGKAYHEVELDAELSSNRYIHPSTFRKASFWKNVILDFVVLILALLLTAALIYGLLGFVLPTAMAYTRTFLIGFSISNAGALLLGLAITYVWLVFLDIALRIVVFHRRLTRA